MGRKSRGLTIVLEFTYSERKTPRLSMLASIQDEKAVVFKIHVPYERSTRDTNDGVDDLLLAWGLYWVVGGEDGVARRFLTRAVSLSQKS